MSPSCTRVQVAVAPGCRFILTSNELSELRHSDRRIVAQRAQRGLDWRDPGAELLTLRTTPELTAVTPGKRLESPGDDVLLVHPTRPGLVERHPEDCLEAGPVGARSEAMEKNGRQQDRGCVGNDF